MKSAGISLVNIATNHALDSDAAGLVSTIGYLDQAGLAHVGAAATADGSTDYTQNVGGVNIGFIGYTNSSNGYSLDSDAECVLNTLNDYDAQSIETLCNRVSAMKDETDLVAVMLNFGSVESDSIETDQQALAQKLCDAGADLIFGTGSRVMKPVEKLSSEDETGQSTRSCLVLYGMGALLSGETYASSEKDTDISAVFDFNITRNDFGETAIQSFTVTPVYLNWYNGAIQPIPVCEAKDTDKYTEMLDDNAMDRINSAYEGTITHLLDGSGLTSTYENYAYHVSLQ